MKIPSLKKIIKREAVVVTPVAVPKKVTVKKVVVKKTVTKAPAKKVVPKPVSVGAKKASAKKAAAKKVDPKRLVVASDSESFWVTNGHVLNSLVALEAALKTMTKSVYDYHISDSGSDFADWVETVLMAPHCALELRKANTAKAALVVVTAYLTEHQL